MAEYKMRTGEDAEREKRRFEKEKKDEKTTEEQERGERMEGRDRGRETTGRMAASKGRRRLGGAATGRFRHSS